MGDHTVYQAFLNRPPCNSKAKPGRLEGEVIAFSAGFGKIRWRTRIGPTESSPLLADGRVYVGDWRGRVYALDGRTGKRALDVPGQGPDQGRGREVREPALRRHLRRLSLRAQRDDGQGDLADALAGPARRPRPVLLDADGRLRARLHRLDGRKVYSFGAASGKLRWSQGTGGYVYGSPAVWRKTVYVGSYSGRFYALDAATGDVRWRFRANGDISGSATVLNGVVYFSTFKERTYALDARTGRQLWTFEDGKYGGVVADRDRLYLVGHARVYGMVEK